MAASVGVYGEVVMLKIDGAMGEGGGQVLRTSLTLSLVTGTPFEIEGIRANRSRPGLLRQHLTAVEAAAAVGGAVVEGAELRSSSLRFAPKGLRAGEYHFAVGTAGSAGLVFQTVMPALLKASGPSRLVLEGGTHNPSAPPFEFLASAYAPLVRRLGGGLELELERPGFYPAGGGRFVARITPPAGGELRPLALLERGGEVEEREACALVAHLPRSIGEREARKLVDLLGWPGGEVRVEEAESSAGPGNCVWIRAKWPYVTEVFSGFGEKGVKAEDVAKAAVDAYRHYLSVDAPVGVHMTDQLMLLLALAGAGRFRSLPPSLHARTNAEVISRFLPVDVRFEAEEGPGRVWSVRVVSREA